MDISLALSFSSKEPFSPVLNKHSIHPWSWFQEGHWEKSAEPRDLHKEEAAEKDRQVQRHRSFSCLCPELPKGSWLRSGSSAAISGISGSINQCWSWFTSTAEECRTLKLHGNEGKLCTFPEKFSREVRPCRAGLGPATKLIYYIKMYCVIPHLKIILSASNTESFTKRKALLSYFLSVSLSD